MGIKYFDHAASSWPKPPAVIEAMNECLLEFAANPGRGSHKLAVKASRTLFETRDNLSKLFQIHNPNDISFALNTSQALNQAIKGFLKAGDHVISTSLEHNSVRRPLEFLKAKLGIDVTYIATDQNGNLNIDDIARSIRKNTSLFVCTHSSNLLGSILPLKEISEILKPRNVKLLVDAAQTAGTYPISVVEMGIDMLAFPGHKGLLGPQGTGGLYLHPEIELEPLMHGGTGSQSEMIDQPSVRPDRYETGTQNTVGIAGLNEGVKFVLREKVENIHAKEWALVQKLMQGLQKINGIEILGPKLGEDRTGIVAFRMNQVDASEAAFMFDKNFDIAVRAGYHCTPLAHETAGTMATGAVRASVGYYTTEEEVDYFIEAAEQINHYQKK